MPSIARTATALALLLLSLCAAAPLAAVCEPDAETLCLLDGRFRVEAQFKNQYAGPSAQPVRAQALPLADRTGAFYFFDRDAYDLIVKIVDGRGLNGRFWVFVGTLTDVEFRLTVMDTSNGDQRAYINPPGHVYGITDTGAFAPRPGPFCGGIAGITCAEPGAFCDPDPGTCDFADGGGVCTIRPQTCVPASQPVCGCDNRTYGNDCERQRADVGRRHTGACPGGQPGS